MTNRKILRESKEYYSAAPQDEDLERSLLNLLERWREAPSNTDIYIDMQSIFERLRLIPEGHDRSLLMNTVVRTLGVPENLAVLVDALRHSVFKTGSADQRASKDKLTSVKMHSVYGWCGNTLLLETLSHPTVGTTLPDQNIANRFRNSTITGWNLSIHIWQPNTCASGFSASDLIPRGHIVEPPHSHPFDFASMVVKGELFQSRYSEISPGDTPERNGYYFNVPLQKVDGVWPPHNSKRSALLETLEDKVKFAQGDSYYMRRDTIHDVEIVESSAKTTPTITLFLNSEFVSVPNVYLSSSLADYHDRNSEIKQLGKPVSLNTWSEKMLAISNYLRGNARELDLNSIVNYKGSYAFFHRNPKDLLSRC